MPIGIFYKYYFFKLKNSYAEKNIAFYIEGDVLDEFRILFEIGNGGKCRER